MVYRFSWNESKISFLVFTFNHTLYTVCLLMTLWNIHECPNHHIHRSYQHANLKQILWHILGLRLTQFYPLLPPTNCCFNFWVCRAFTVHVRTELESRNIYNIWGSQNSGRLNSEMSEKCGKGTHQTKPCVCWPVSFEGKVEKISQIIQRRFSMIAGIVTAVPITSFSTDTWLLFLVWFLSSSKMIRELHWGSQFKPKRYWLLSGRSRIRLLAEHDISRRRLLVVFLCPSMQVPG